MSFVPDRADREPPRLRLLTGPSKLASLSVAQSGPSKIHCWSRSVDYPSPPMSNSPPPPRQRDPNGHEYSRPSYGVTGPNVSQVAHSSQGEATCSDRAPLLRTYQPEYRGPPAHSFTYGTEGTVASFPYPTRPPPPPPPPPPPMLQVQQAVQAQYDPQYPPQLSMYNVPSGAEGSASSPKTQRKTKGHVASACVPCKRAHLRCDAQRPCSRCQTNGKEDTCVDVQHKKRGRPRLRDEREVRFEGMVAPYGAPPMEAARLPLRRPMSLYATSDNPITTPFESLQRSSSYKVLKSQGGSSMGPRHLEHASSLDANVYGGSNPLAPRLQSFEERPCAYLTMNLQVAKATPEFCDIVGVESIAGRKLIDIVSQPDRDRVLRFERIFEEERRAKEPSYLPPIYLRYEEDRVIQSVGFHPTEFTQFELNHSEVFTFQGPNGRHKPCPVRLGLAKRDSTYFVVILLESPTMSRVYPQPLASPFSAMVPRDSRAHASLHDFQVPQQSYLQGSMMPVLRSSPLFGDPRIEQRTEPRRFTASVPPGSIMSPGANASNMGAAHVRHDHIHSPREFQIPAGESRQIHSRPLQDLQLPPIRDPHEEAAIDALRGRRDPRDHRVDIGGLIENPNPGRRN